MPPDALRARAHNAGDDRRDREPQQERAAAVVAWRCRLGSARAGEERRASGRDEPGPRRRSTARGRQRDQRAPSAPINGSRMRASVPMYARSPASGCTESRAAIADAIAAAPPAPPPPPRAPRKPMPIDDHRAGSATAGRTAPRSPATTCAAAATRCRCRRSTLLVEIRCQFAAYAVVASRSPASDAAARTCRRGGRRPPPRPAPARRGRRRPGPAPPRSPEGRSCRSRPVR